MSGELAVQEVVSPLMKSEWKHRPSLYQRAR
jgi:hypothetical protein